MREVESGAKRGMANANPRRVVALVAWKEKLKPDEARKHLAFAWQSGGANQPRCRRGVWLELGQGRDGRCRASGQVSLKAMVGTARSVRAEARERGSRGQGRRSLYSAHKKRVCRFGQSRVRHATSRRFEPSLGALRGTPRWNGEREILSSRSGKVFSPSTTTANLNTSVASQRPCKRHAILE